MVYKWIITGACGISSKQAGHLILNFLSFCILLFLLIFQVRNFRSANFRVCIRTFQKATCLKSIHDFSTLTFNGEAKNTLGTCRIKLKDKMVEESKEDAREREEGGIAFNGERYTV